ncbi:hypothetical protein [Ideonella sp.]|uniref:hypothetical protein n=1 Tax=Ideonella sp. TaxID=1929293 RepID=UPI0035B10450
MTSLPRLRRRALLAGSAAALAAGWLPSGAAARRLTGTAYAIPRNRYSLSRDFFIPKLNFVTLIPMDVVRFEEAAFSSLLPDGMVRIEQTGLYRVLTCLDWKAQEGTDIDLRMFTIRRKTASDTGGPLGSDERLAAYDASGSDSPVTARYSGSWAPPSVPARGYVYTDVTVATPGQHVEVGDVAQAALAAAAPDRIGTDAALALQVRAQVIARDTVRVVLHNTRAKGAIQVPEGALKVMAQSTTAYRGDSEDAWNVLGTPLTELFAGERLYVAAKNMGVTNDYVQASTTTTFLQLEKFG